MNTFFDTLQLDKPKLRSQLQNSTQVCIITHRNPDGDALGSALAIYHVLKQLGSKVNVVLPNAAPAFLQWMPGFSSVLEYENNEKKVRTYIKESDLLMFTDFNALNRINGIADLIQNSNAFKIHIDHHPDPELFADIMVSNTDVSSSAELVYLFLKYLELHETFNTDFATAIFTGILTDTGKFSHNSSRVTTYQVVSHLLELGIDKDGITASIYDNYSHSRMQLLGFCLDKKLEYIPEYNTAIISISADELKQYNYQPGDTEGFVNYPLSISGVKFSALFIERENTIKLSFRSKNNFAVNEFMQRHFKGGGHRNAAGGESGLTMDEAIDKFKSELQHYAEDLS